MKNIVFYLGLGTFATHELDAMTYHEWRVLPLTSWLPDEYGILVFLFLHIPLFAILIALIASTNEKIRYRSRIGISIFLIFHGLLHTLFMGNANYEFFASWSNILIFGGATLGIIYLVLEYLEKRKIST
jgi:hypothetical protein